MGSEEAYFILSELEGLGGATAGFGLKKSWMVRRAIFGFSAGNSAS
jgi:hypothetical protein